MLNAQPPKLSNVPVALQAYKQFILWRFVIKPDSSRDKVPCSVFGQAINHLDPANWLTAADAMQLQHRGAFGVGFVFTRDDPFFFIDLDNCFVGGQLTAGSRDIVSMFPGAWFERSQSGGGVHIIASAERVEHGTRGSHLGQKVELYSEGRFVALTGIEAQGDPSIFHAPQLRMLIEVAGLQPKHAIATPGGPTPLPALSGPRPDATAPADDNALMILARDSVGSGDAMFGGGVRFWDLWTANAPALAQRWPDTRPGRTFGWSEADQALIAQLEFWTGKDRERVARLFKQSALYRPEKYEGSGAYRLRKMLDWAQDHILRYYNHRPPAERLKDVLPKSSASPSPVPMDHASRGLLVNDLMKQKYPEPEFLVKGLVAPGVYILAGRPKRGKSWMMLDLSLAVAEGGFFLERQCKQGDVIYFALEDNRRRMQGRLREMMNRMLVINNQTMRVITMEDSIRPMDGGFLLDLEMTLNANPNIRFIGIDTLAMVKFQRRGSEDVYTADRRSIDPLANLCSRFPHLTIFVVHHTNKLVADDPMDGISGSTGLFAAFDGGFLIHTDKESGHTLLYGRTRETGDIEMPIKFAMPKWEVLGEDVDEMIMNESGKKILDALKDGPLSMSEIADVSGISRQNTHARLKSLMKTEHVMREGRLYIRKG